VQPTLSHYFIRLLAEKGLLLRNFTQNIDTLERRAGIHEDFLVEAHGAFHMAHCIDCGLEHQHEYVRGEEDMCVNGTLPDTKHTSTLVLQMRYLLVGSPCAHGRGVPGYHRRRVNLTMAWSNLVRFWSLQ